MAPTLYIPDCTCCFTFLLFFVSRRGHPSVLLPLIGTECTRLHTCKSYLIDISFSSAASLNVVFSFYSITSALGAAMDARIFAFLESKSK